MIPKPRTPLFFVNILIALSFVAVPLFVFDLLLKFLRFDVEERGSRQMFLASSYISNENYFKYRHYAPSSTPTHITTVNNHVEYQYQFRTDALGFRTTYQCTNQAFPRQLITIHGDSFTEGQGVERPWIAAFQKSLCSKGFASINMAMPGNGVSDFQSTINLANNLFPKSPKVLAVIDHDFFRQSYNVKADPDCSRYYLNNPKENNCETAKVKWIHIADVSEVPDQLEIAKTQKMYGLMPMAQALAKRLKSLLDQRLSFSYSLNSTIYKKSTSALESYLTNSPDPVLLIRLPMQSEILKSQDSFQHSSNLANISQRTPNVVYLDLAKTCPLVSDDFFDNDPHPNQLGHNKLSSCLLSSDMHRQFVSRLRP